MDLKQLQYFVVSVESGSFKKAADTLYTTQPHISKSIKALETELGVQLLSRKARGVELTDAGKKIYEYACNILVDAAKIHAVEASEEKLLHMASCAGDKMAALCAVYCKDIWNVRWKTCFLHCIIIPLTWDFSVQTRDGWLPTFR